MLKAPPALPDWSVAQKDRLLLQRTDSPVLVAGRLVQVRAPLPVRNS
jgi:hypothetical protein